MAELKESTVNGDLDVTGNLSVEGEITNTEFNNLITAIASFITNSGQTDLSALGTWLKSNIDTLNSDVDTLESSKQDTITGGATTITSSNLTASRALVSDSSGKVAVSAVTSTELGYLDGVTSAIQTQLNNKGVKAVLGGNATNGYIRFPDVKVQICWEQKIISSTCNSAWGVLYECATPIEFANWKATFSGIPTVAYGVRCDSQAAGMMLQIYKQASATNPGSFIITRPTALTNAFNYRGMAIGIGTYS